MARQRSILAEAFAWALAATLLVGRLASAETLLAEADTNLDGVLPGEELVVRTIERVGEIVVEDAEERAGHVVNSRGFVVLKIAPYGEIPLTRFVNAKIALDVESASVNGREEQRRVVLEVGFDPSNGFFPSDRAVAIFEDAARLQATVTEVVVTDADGAVVADSSVLERLTLTATVEAEHFYEPQPSEAPAPGPADLRVGGGAGDLRLSWEPIRWAESYDLEWTHVDDYSRHGLYAAESLPEDGATIPNRHPVLARPTTALAYDFRSNRTRISVDDTSYELPVTFERGYLLWRVRAVGRDPDNPAQRIAGLWSSFRGDFGSDFSPSDVGVVHLDYNASYTAEIARHGDGRAVRDRDGLLLRATSKNWQHVATYAEGGRRSDLVRYLDGTMRERQVVTRRNSDGELLVGESIPDHRGRTAVEFLAAPVDMEGGPRVPIRYERNFNLNDEGQPYTFRDFEVDLGDGPRGSPSAPIRGASQYFSPENRNREGHQGYTPDALGFPFSHRLFTADDTGRVIAEGGPGPMHQIGSGHETRTYYGVPDQSELDRLFGNDAGLADHYKKQSTVDPDGQVTVAYLDPSGKIVASALAGNVPSGLETLDPETPELLVVSTVFDLLEADQQVSGGERALSSSKTIFLADAGPVAIRYSAAPPLIDPEGCSGDGCYRCAYELDIRITDDGGRVVFPHGSGASEWPKLFSLDEDITTPCSEIPQSIQIDPIKLNLERGAYRISKTLTVVESRLDAAAKHFADEARNSCLAAELGGIEEALADGATPGSCSESCRACDLEQVRQRVRLSEEEGGAWAELFSERRVDIGQSCQRSCAFDPIESPCEAGFQAILADVSPGGQYGIAPSSAGPDPLSVFNEANDLPVNRLADTIGNWRHPFPRYVDDDGSSSVVYLSGENEGACRATRPDGGCLPQDLETVELFLAHWRSTWAEALAPMHPEYGYHEFCKRQPDVVSFPQRLRAISRFSDARSWLPDDREPSVDLTSPEGLLAADPLFPVRPAPEPERTRLFRDTLADFTLNPGEGGSNLSLPANLTIVATVHLVAGECNNPLFDEAEARACASAAGAIGETPGNEDNEWRYLRDLYLSRRADVLYGERSGFVDGSALYFSNRCIGDPAGTGCGSQIPSEWYGEKVKRFPENRDALDLVPDDDFDIVRDWNERRLYEQCGLCGLHTELEALLSGAARRGLLVASSTIPRFPVIPGPKLIEAFSRVGGLPVSLPVDDQYTWSVNVSGDALDIEIRANVEFPIWTGGSEIRNVRVGQLRLRKPGGSPSWGDVRWFHGLSPLVNRDPELFDRTGDSFFSIRGMLADTCTTALENGCFVEVEGEAVGFDLSSCDLPRLCTGSEAADQMASFAGYLFSDMGRALSRSFFRIPDDDDILGPLIRDFGSSGDYHWRFSHWGLEEDTPERTAFTAELRRGSTGIEFFDECKIRFETSRPIREDEISLTVLGPKKIFRESEDLTRVVLADRNEEAGNGSQCDSAIVALDAIDEDGEPLEIQVGSSCHTFSNCCVDPASCPSTEETPRVEGPLLQGDNPIFGGRPPVLNLPDNILALLNPARLENLPACNTCSYPIEPAIPYPNTCPAQEKQVIETALEQAKDEHRDDTRRRFRNDMLSQCLAVEETFTATFDERTYHFTLFYYDQAGNLLRTVPPKGVELLSPEQIAQVACHRLAQDEDSTNDCDSPPADPLYPSHTMATTYAYNSLNQVTEKTTPDSGTTRYWYDPLGRVVTSRDANQAEAGDLYGYVAYDELGRVCEAGEVRTDVDPATIAAECRNGEVTGIPLEARTEYTRTYYDRPMNTTVDGYFDGGQQNLRNRVASAERVRHDPDNFTWEHRTHFSYDIHGNVATLIQENPLMPEGHRVKRIEYDYDQISGKINRMTYQSGVEDQFIHRYEYDADNRLKRVFTSTDGVLWDRDAEYTYYAHGPLARVELGEHRVQGTDYAYTIHGWLKGINSDTLLPSRDIGKDGVDAPFPGGSHSEVAADAFGMSLGYFDGDYRPISGLAVPDMFAADVVGDAFEGREGLYNGDISHLVYAYPGAEGMPDIWAEQMAYDQFGRLREVVEVREADTGLNSWLTGRPSPEARASYTYDANGNFLRLLRRNREGSEIDDLTFAYYEMHEETNRLAYVSDTVAKQFAGVPNQFDPNCDPSFEQLNCNYSYDPRGQMIRDLSANIPRISWTELSKIRRLEHLGNDIRFGYDSHGYLVMDHRPAKKIWFVRNERGNILARYEEELSGISLAEMIIYGDEKIGARMQFGKSLSGVSASNLSVYEITDHIGNVRGLLDEAKIPIKGSASAVQYENSRFTWQDYFPFGLSSGEELKYSFGLHGMQKSFALDDRYITQYRTFDSSVALWMSPDKIDQPSKSPYIAFNGNPNIFRDRSGLNDAEEVRSALRQVQQVVDRHGAGFDGPASPRGTRLHGQISHTFESIGNPRIISEAIIDVDGFVVSHGGPPGDVSRLIYDKSVIGNIRKRGQASAWLETIDGRVRVRSGYFRVPDVLIVTNADHIDAIRSGRISASRRVLALDAKFPVSEPSANVQRRLNRTLDLTNRLGVRPEAVEPGGSVTRALRRRARQMTQASLGALRFLGPVLSVIELHEIPAQAQDLAGQIQEGREAGYQRTEEQVEQNINESGIFRRDPSQRALR